MAEGARYPMLTCVRDFHERYRTCWARECVTVNSEDHENVVSLTAS